MPEIAQPESDVEIILERELPDYELYRLEHPHGAIDALFRPSNSWYQICNFDVDRDVRRQGIGKQLIRASADHARRLGARSIFSMIVSRESLVAMKAVFGSEALDVDALGDFAPPGSDRPAATRTSAILLARIT